jgi:hypothetical protein
MSRRPSPISKVGKWVLTHELLISPLAGEMSGRTEGGGWVLTLAGAAYSACVV